MMPHKEEIITKIMELLRNTGEREIEIAYAFIRSLTKK